MRLYMQNITKTFLGGRIIANDNISLDVKSGEIHAIIGENGAGKSTLMSVLFGIYTPDAGNIQIDGRDVEIKNPNHASEIGIGMVHQHFKLIDTLTVAENIMLGQERIKNKVVLDLASANTRVKEISERYGFNIDPKSIVGKLSIGQKQKVEIIKMLWKDKDILIFDEPTAVLTPDEIAGFLEMLRNFKEEGKTIIIITHKLGEVKDIADNYTVLRRGKNVAEGNVKTATIEKMASEMVGKQIALDLPRGKSNAGDVVIKVENLSYVLKDGTKKLDNVSFEIRANEILGFAGVEGNGQDELVKCIYGILKPTAGRVLINDVDVTNMGIHERKQLVSYITEDRHGFGLILDMKAKENVALTTIDEFSKYGILNGSKIKKYYQDIKAKFDLRGSDDGEAPARGMSGGNQQKLIIGREVVKEHKVLLASQPTRGLDIGAIENTYKYIVEDRENGAAVLLVSFELPEILGVSDRIAIINKGQIVEIIDGKKATAEQIGIAMAGITKGKVVK